MNFISSLFLFKCLLFDKKFLSSFLQLNNWSISREKSFSYARSQCFLSFPMDLINILCNESNRLIKYLFMFSTCEYSLSNFANEEFPLILWFCLIRYWPKNKHGLKRWRTSSSICSVLFISSYNYLESAIMPSVSVGRSFSTK